MMKRYFYSVLEMKFTRTITRTIINEEEVVASGHNLESSRLLGRSVTTSVKEFIKECENEGLTRRPFYFDSEESLGDVFVFDEEPNTVLGLYRFEVEQPGQTIYILDENFKLRFNSPLSVKRSEPITSTEEFIERSVELIEEHNVRNDHWHKLGHARFYIGHGVFENALPFPHNVGLYIEDKEKGLGR